MQSTRSHILDLLKRHGGATVDELSKVLGLASMTIRQHLAILERDSYIAAKEVRRQTGRPHHFYSLTDKGDALFPRSYDSLVDSVLRELRDLDPAKLSKLGPEQKVEYILTRAADRLVEQNKGRVDGLCLEEKIREVTRILNEEGTLSDWHKTDDGYEIRAYNCPYIRVSQTTHQLCTAHYHFLAEILDAPGGVRRLETLAQGGSACQYFVPDKPK